MLPSHDELYTVVLNAYEPGEPSHFRDLAASLAAELDLDQVSLAETIRGGKQKFENRVEWAITDLVHAELLERVGNGRSGMTRLTSTGAADRDSLPTLAQGEARRDLAERYPPFAEWLTRTREQSRQRREQAALEALVSEPTGSGTTLVRQAPAAEIDEAELPPEAQLENAEQRHLDQIAVELIDEMRTLPPGVFEELVLELLQKMGYGGSLEEPGQHVGGSGDGGIDGIIDEDPLGLDKVLIQAKRYGDGNAVTPEQVRAFVAAVRSKHARKGVMITTSRFTEEAKRAATGPDAAIVLIDGTQLVELCVKYHVGLEVERTIEVYSVSLRRS